MPFAYYKKLNARQKRIYDRSEAVPSVKLPGAAKLRSDVDAIALALQSENRKDTEQAANVFTEKLLRALRVSLVDVKVLSKRPSNSWGELHGLYEPSDGKQRPLLTVWMRTAMRKDVVAFKSFLRTLLHEIGHHLDYELLGLEDSYHTQGFYKRESSLFHQLVPNPARYDVRKSKKPTTSRSRKGAATVGTATKKTVAVGKSTGSRGRKKAPAEPASTPQKKREPVQGSLFD